MPELLTEPSRGPLVAGAEQRHVPGRLDGERCWVCPTLTPLFYATDAWGKLNDAQRLRYNQLTALYFADVISGFEAAGSSVLAVLRSRQKPESTLSARLGGFIDDEANHIAMWRGLLADGKASSSTGGSGRGGVVLSLIRRLMRLPGAMPLQFWLMLALEEHGVEISRRCMRTARGDLEPHFFAAFRDHLKDEVRHVQLDVDLIQQFYAPLSMPRRRVIAWVLRQLISRVLLAPHKASRRVVAQLVAEYPELTSSQRAIRAQLKAVGANRDYQEMMYSRKTTPQLFAMFDRFPEMHAMAGVLAGYQPRAHD